MFPLFDNVPTRRVPVVTYGLIAANLAVWFWELNARGSRIDDYAFYPCAVSGPCVGPAHGHLAWPEGVLTSMFLHASWLHVLGNMLFLWIFGNNVEDRLGRPRFAAFYLLGGVAAIALQWAFDRSSDLPTIGASGAIAAVLAGYLLLYPRAVVVTLVGWIPVPLPAMLFLVIWIGLQVLGAAAGFSQAGGGSEGGVAYFAHVGGFVFGLAAVRALDRGT
jgi:membrane associated rhomboid family serine protease